MKHLTDYFLKVGLLVALTFFTSLEAQAATLNYTVIDSSLIRITTPANLVIRNKTDWQTFYKAATSHLFPQPAVPSIDFTKYAVVVVASGERATGGYKTLISSVADIPATTTVASYINVDAVLINPEGCMVSQSFTYPVAMFTVAKTAKPFVFKTGNVYNKCL